MRIYRWLPLLALALLSIRAWPMPIPSQGATRSIMISSLTGWFLKIKADGSGWLQFGQGGLDGGPFPAGTFSFPKIYRRVVDEGSTVGNAMHEDMVISLDDRRAIPATLYWQNWVLAKKWMALAYAKSRFFDKERMSELHRDRPFLPCTKSP